jgi:hypothetical protein
MCGKGLLDALLAGGFRMGIRGMVPSTSTLQAIQSEPPYSRQGYGDVLLLLAVVAPYVIILFTLINRISARGR